MLASLLLARTLLAFASACLRLPFGVAIVAVAAAATAITSGQSEEYSRNRDIHGREPGTSKKLDRVTGDPRLPASAGTSRPLQTLHLLLQRVPITNQTSTKSKMPRNNNLDSRYLGVPTTGARSKKRKEKDVWSVKENSAKSADGPIGAINMTHGPVRVMPA
ncbi:unnamed protein product [Colletotrichum noveboracense]|uniref:Secreted protein n=1 Tax=Colletotrichum noveboracense TaxID=2664923 RepID=A0A9W4WHL9_9PEZI|nr:unnamed protein product [Colletotrichum noveboracense]